VPLVISALLYALIFHLLLPLYRRHRARYSHYLPLSIASTSNPIGVPDTTNLRHRVTEALYAFLPNFRWAENWLLPARESITDASAGLDDEDGDEELDEAVWDGTDRHIEGFHSHRPDNRRRLSRELEEGFRDSSDDEAPYRRGSR
jgi:hypothetical protein